MATLVERVELRNFRTWRRLDLGLTSGLTAIVGANGVGKTNLLEGIAWLLAGTSPRTSNEPGCVTAGEPFLRVAGSIVAGDTRHELASTLQLGSGKRHELDGAAVTSTGSYGARFPSITFLPERLLVVRGAPARRRALLDRVATRMDPSFSGHAAAYVRAMTQRNALLRRHRMRGPVPEAELAPWDALLVEHGSAIRASRSDLLLELGRRFRDRFAQLTDLPGGEIRIELRGTDIAAALVDVRGIDARRATTGAGPHLDDIAFLQDGRDLRGRGSTGEQRAALLAFALAEADVVTSATGSVPIVLLDEPLAELDADRRRRLLVAIDALPQVVLTATDHDVPDPSALPAGARVLAVHSGQVHEWHHPAPENPSTSAS